jgi:hypothetical protein
MQSVSKDSLKSVGNFTVVDIKEKALALIGK